MSDFLGNFVVRGHLVGLAQVVSTVLGLINVHLLSPHFNWDKGP